MAFNFNYLNVFSKDFLQNDLDAAELRKLEVQNNSVGADEDQVNWGAIVGQWGQYSTQAEVDSSNILFDAVFANKRQRISFYRSMALYPLVKKALTIMTDEAVSENTKGEVAKFDIKAEFKNSFKVSEYNRLKREFDYIMNCVVKKDDLWYYFYRWLVDGEQFWELCSTNDGKALAGIKVLPSYCSLVMYNDGVAEGYVQDPKLIDLNSQEEIKKFSLHQVSYSSYGFWGMNRNDIRGHLEAAIRPLNQLRAIEDALTVYRITRAPEKRIFNIYTGRCSNAEARAKIQDAKAKYRKVLSIDPVTGVINSTKNIQAMSEDFWFSKDSDGTGSTVESFKGSVEFNGQLDDVKMFQQQVMDAMQVPTSRWHDAENPGTYAMAPEQQLTEISFQKLCRRLGKKFANEMLLHTYIEHLRLRGFKSKYLDSDIYNITLIGSNDFQKIRELAYIEKIGGIVGSLSTFLPTLANSKDTSEELQPLFSRKFFFANLLKLSTDEILENDAELEKEKQELIDRANASKDESAPEDAEEGGDDMDIGI